MKNHLHFTNVTITVFPRNKTSWVFFWLFVQPSLVYQPFPSNLQVPTFFPKTIFDFQISQLQRICELRSCDDQIHSTGQKTLSDAMRSRFFCVQDICHVTSAIRLLGSVQSTSAGNFLRMYFARWDVALVIRWPWTVINRKSRLRFPSRSLGSAWTEHPRSRFCSIFSYTGWTSTRDTRVLSRMIVRHNGLATHELPGQAT